MPISPIFGNIYVYYISSWTNELTLLICELIVGVQDEEQRPMGVIYADIRPMPYVEIITNMSMKRGPGCRRAVWKVTSSQCYGDGLA